MSMRNKSNGVCIVSKDDKLNSSSKMQEKKMYFFISIRTFSDGGVCSIVSASEDSFPLI